jgi:hypothetical protein
MSLRQAEAVPLQSRRERAIDPTSGDARERVCLTLRVDSIDALDIRRELHRALRERIGVYIMDVDHTRGITTLQLQTCRADIDAIMTAVMNELPHAEFGPIRETPLVSVH